MYARGLQQLSRLPHVVTLDISIHACARIVTNRGFQGGGASFILIHACARIATQKAQEWEEWAAF